MLDLFLHAGVLSQAGQVHTQMRVDVAVIEPQFAASAPQILELVGAMPVRSVTPSSDAGKTEFRTQRLYGRYLC